MGIPNFVVYISTFADYLPELCLAFGMSLSFPRTIADRMRWVRVVCHCVCVCLCVSSNADVVHSDDVDILITILPDVDVSFEKKN